MSACSLHVGDVGAKIGLHFVECCGGGRARDVDLSDADSVTFTFVDAEGEVTEVPAVAADFDGARWDLTDGKAMYVTVPGFLTAPGWMDVQGHAVWDGGARRHSTSIERFHVGPRLGAVVEVVSWENGDVMSWENGDELAWENGAGA